MWICWWHSVRTFICNINVLQQNIYGRWTHNYTKKLIIVEHNWVDIGVSNRRFFQLLCLEAFKHLQTKIPDCHLITQPWGSHCILLNLVSSTTERGENHHRTAVKINQYRWKCWKHMGRESVLECECLKVALTSQKWRSSSLPNPKPGPPAG